MPGKEKAKVPVRGETLAWTMRRAALEAPALAKGLGVSPEWAAVWLTREDLEALQGKN